MKNLLPLLLLSGLVFFSACDKDDDDANAFLLSYDGANNFAPELPAGDYLFAVRFPASETEVYIDSLLTEVQFYLREVPNNVRVRVFGPGSNESPGDSVYESNALTALVEANSWYTHTLNENVTITGDELWLAVVFSHGNNLRSVGCDAGPAHPNGDFIYDASVGVWQKYSEQTPESVNWNIRGKVGRD